MDLFIDDEKIDFQFTPSESLGQGLRRVQNHACADGRMIVGVKSDGVPLLGQELTDALAQPPGDYACLELATSLPAKLVASAMVEASKTLARTDEKRDEIAERLSEGKTAEGLAALTESLAVWHQVHDAIVQSISMLGIDPVAIMVGDEPLERTLDVPKEQLEQIRTALTVQDFVLLADILQYEFPACVQTWQELIETVGMLAAQHEQDLKSVQ